MLQVKHNNPRGSSLNFLVKHYGCKSRGNKKRHILLIFLASLSAITYLDRLCIAVAGPAMQDDLNIAPDQWGWILGIFIITYGIFEIPTGAWGDLFGYRKVISRIVLWWSAFTCLTGLAGNFKILLLIRGLFGMGEAGAYPNISGCIARWFPKTGRAKAQGVIWSASRIGGILAPVIVVPIQMTYGWRTSFWVFGLIGVVWVILWQRWHRNDPGKIKDISQKEINVSEHGEKIPWKKIFSNKQVWLIMIMYWCYVWSSWFYLSWLHTYLVNGKGLTMTEMAFFSPYPFALGAVGNIIGGILSDKFSKRWGLRNGRRIIGSTCMAIAAICLFITSSVSEKIAVIVFLTVAFGFLDCMLPSAWALCLDVGRKYSGIVSGAMNSFASTGGLMCSITFGYIVKSTGNYNLPILIISIMVLFSAVLFLFINPNDHL